MTKNHPFLLMPVSGVLIGFSITLFTYLGSSLVLYLVRLLHLRTEESIFYTSLFYGAVFMFARARMKTRIRQNEKAVRHRLSREEADEEVFIEESSVPGFRAVLWGVFSAVSIGWLTPALAGLWFSSRRPMAFIMLFSLIYSMVGVGMYLLKYKPAKTNALEKLMIYAGSLFSVILLGYVLPGS